MRVLIDGYNLLHASGLISRGRGERALEQARNALLEFLAQQLAPQIAAQTTVVYDASAPPSGLPAIVVSRGITVEFAVDHEEADDRLDELIRAEPAPQHLWVITSDHRIQETARRRGAHRVDSDVWYDAVLERKWPPSPPATSDAQSTPTAKPDKLPDPDEVQQWLDWFSGGEQ
jgi:predicted RNA-binding protein with PIN domain